MRPRGEEVGSMDVVTLHVTTVEAPWLLFDKQRIVQREVPGERLRL